MNITKYKWNYENIGDLVEALRVSESLGEATSLTKIKSYEPLKNLLNYYNNHECINSLWTEGECVNKFIALDKKGVALCITTSFNLVAVQKDLMYFHGEPTFEELEEAKSYVKRIMKSPIKNGLYFTISPECVTNQVVNCGYYEPTDKEVLRIDKEILNIIQKTNK